MKTQQTESKLKYYPNTDMIIPSGHWESHEERMNRIRRERREIEYEKIRERERAIVAARKEREQKRIEEERRLEALNLQKYGMHQFWRIKGFLVYRYPIGPRMELSTEDYSGMEADEIIRIVEEEVSAPYGAVKGKERKRKCAYARHKACYLIRLNKGWSLTRIARWIDRDHTTVLHSIRSHSRRFNLPMPEDLPEWVATYGSSQTKYIKRIKENGEQRSTRSENCPPASPKQRKEKTNLGTRRDPN